MANAGSQNGFFVSHICSKGKADAEVAAAYDVAVTNPPRRR